MLYIILINTCKSFIKDNINSFYIIFKFLDKTTTLCATCGGDAVCFIDCKTGEVAKKYKQPGEVFYCLAWTVCPVENSGVTEYRTALAVGGKQCDIRIIQPENLVCYDSIEAHEGPIESLHFHPTRPTWLFSECCNTVKKNVVNQF